MTIIQFANGKKVNFNGNPTPDDVDHVAQQLGITGNSQAGLGTFANQPAPSVPAPTPTGQASIPTPPAPIPNPPQSFLGKVASGVGNVVKGITAPVVTMLARPFQAGAELLGASAQDVNDFSSKIPFYGENHALDVPQNAADVEKDVGRGAETVALGLNPVAGGALYGAGNSVEQGNDILSGKTALEAGLGGVAGKALDFAAPFLGKVAGAVVPKFAKDIAGKAGDLVAPAIKGIEDFAGKTKILPDSISNTINKGADALNAAPTQAVGAIKSQYGGVAQGTDAASLKNEAETQVSKALGNTGKKSAGVFAQGDTKRLAGLETLYDEAPNLKVTDEAGAQIPYDPTTASMGQHVEALDNAKKNIYSQIESNLNSATKGGATIDTSAEQTRLNAIANDPGRAPEAQARASQVSASISKIKTPTQLNSFLQDLNSGLSGVASGASQNIARRIDMEVTKNLGDVLDGTVLNSEGDNGVIKGLKSKYSNLKSVESGLVSKAQQMARKGSGGMGGGLYDYINPYNIADMFDILTNPGSAVKAGVRSVLNLKAANAKNPENILQGIFKNIDQYRNLSKGIPLPTGGILPNLAKTSAAAGATNMAFPR